MKDIQKLISTTVFNTLNEGWYHGTPESKKIEAAGGFINKTRLSAEYVKDLAEFRAWQDQLNILHKTDEDAYFKLLEKADELKGRYNYVKPLFLSNNRAVASTYAVHTRAFDYQDASEKVYEVDVDCAKSVTIIATGDRFRFINVDKVKQGFVRAGVSEQEIDKLIAMFNFYVPNNKGIKTDVIAAIGNWLGFDCIDVVGVLDSYEGGSVKSTVRMVLHPEKAQIVT